MTNKEYYIKNNTSFANALKEYDDKKYPTVDEWLNSGRITNHKFNCGDIVFCKAYDSKFLITKINYGCVDLYEGVAIREFGDGEIDLIKFHLPIDICDRNYKKVGHC